MARDAEFIINSLKIVLARGHGTIPIPCADLRILLDEIEALKHDVERHIEIATSLSNGDRGSAA